MPTIAITNTVPSQALRGQNVKITLSANAALGYLPQLAVGMKCQDGDKIGYIYSVDYYGNSFEVSPEQPNLNMSDDNSGFYGTNTLLLVSI